MSSFLVVSVVYVMFQRRGRRYNPVGTRRQTTEDYYDATGGGGGGKKVGVAASSFVVAARPLMR